MVEINLKEVCEKFRLNGTFLSAQRYGEGHINDTFLVKTDRDKYILQRVNDNVFKNPKAVMENIALVTEFIQKQVMLRGGDVKREALTLIRTIDDMNYYEAEDGKIFRMYVFIDNATSHQIIKDGKVFYQAAKAFGRFQKILKKFPANELSETIVNFHNTKDRFCKLKEAIKNDKLGRLSTVKAEVDFALKREEDAGIIVDALSSGEIPYRVTHNDTKLNNIMIDDETGAGICVIDLDTVMPGSLLYDFGDSIRFGASTAPEDELDLDKVSMDIELFEEYAKGYLEELGDDIEKKEIELLSMSAKIMTLECGVRFLTDYLDGDTYFKIHRENHNLDRARTQFKLVWDMEQKMERMQEIVSKFINK